MLQATFPASYKVDTHAAMCLTDGIYASVDSMCGTVEGIHIRSSFTKTYYKLVMSVFILHEQLRHYQFLVHSLTHNKYFDGHVVHMPLYTQIFSKFKSSCILSQ